MSEVTSSLHCPKKRSPVSVSLRYAFVCRVRASQDQRASEPRCPYGALAGGAQVCRCRVHPGGPTEACTPSTAEKNLPLPGTCTRLPLLPVSHHHLTVLAIEDVTYRGALAGEVAWLTALAANRRHVQLLPNTKNKKVKRALVKDCLSLSYNVLTRGRDASRFERTRRPVRVLHVHRGTSTSAHTAFAC